MQWGGLLGVGGIAAVTAVIASGDDVHHYPLPVSVARERLAATPLPGALVGIGGQPSLTRQSDGLLWRLGDPDRQSEARVSLDGDGASTNVTIHVRLADNALDGSHVAASKLTRTLAESIFLEHVDAVLGNRPFDQQRMALGAAHDLQADPRMLQEFGSAIRQDMLDTATFLDQQAPGRGDPPGRPADFSRTALRGDPGSVKPMTNVQN